MSIGRRLLSLALPLFLLLLAATPAWADGPATLEVQAPESVTLGEEAAVTAVLKDSQGAPIPNATVVLWMTASFLSTGGAIELGRATTDLQGKALFRYQPRSEDSIGLNVYFPGDSRYDPASASVEIAVRGSAQLYQQTAGVRLPGIGVWLLVALLGVVWSIYLGVMVLLALIAREGPQAQAASGGTDA